MSTKALPVALVRNRAAWDRRFYLIMALATEAVILTGFSPTYYLKFRHPMAPSLSLLVHLHALIFTLWMIYFIAQTMLIAIRRPILHRRLGVTGAFLGAAVIGMGLTVAVVAMRLGHGNLTQDAAVIFLVSLIDIGSFAMFFLLGYWRRRDREAHQRLMLLAVIIGLAGAGIGRLLAFGLPIRALTLIDFALLFAGPIYDLVTRRSIHSVYRWGIPYALITFTPFRFLVGATPWWHHVAHWIVRG